MNLGWLTRVQEPGIDPWFDDPAETELALREIAITRGRLVIDECLAVDRDGYIRWQRGRARDLEEERLLREKQQERDRWKQRRRLALAARPPAAAAERAAIYERSEWRSVPDDPEQLAVLRQAALAYLEGRAQWPAQRWPEDEWVQEVAA